MNRASQTFFFEGYSLDTELGVVQFHFSFDHDLIFTETWEIKTDKTIELSPLIDRVLFHAQFAIGISYWKTYCPKKISIRSGGLTDRQAEFWNRVYTKGLGEFFYMNKIDSRQLVHFPVDRDEPLSPVMIEETQRTLLPLGGGKDSLTAASLMDKMDLSYDTFSLGGYPVILNQTTKLPGNHFTIERTLDGELFRLNEQGAYNGHVPISSIYAFASLLTAAIEGHQYIALSNERSANEGNVEYLGSIINHQWSKSFEFEKLFQEYVHQSISPQLTYFSLLRPLSELHIVKLFAELDNWHTEFTSCNRTFTRRAEGSVQWCGTCPKCLFVFTILAPFVPKNTLVELFGRNPLADKTLLPLFKDLLGETESKPFDCVGTPEEIQVAFAMIIEGGEYKGDVIIEQAASVLPNQAELNKLRQLVFTPTDEHRIPKVFQSYLDELK